MANVNAFIFFGVNSSTSITFLYNLTLYICHVWHLAISYIFILAVGSWQNMHNYCVCICCFKNQDKSKKKKKSTARFTHSLPTVLFNISKCVWLPLLVFFFFFLTFIYSFQKSKFSYFFTSLKYEYNHIFNKKCQ